MDSSLASRFCIAGSSPYQTGNICCCPLWRRPDSTLALVWRRISPWAPVTIARYQCQLLNCFMVLFSANFFIDSIKLFFNDTLVANSCLRTWVVLLLSWIFWIFIYIHMIINRYVLLWLGSCRSWGSRWCPSSSNSMASHLDAPEPW